jgi:hypothetical protein
MSDLKGATGELRATIHITRKATGKVETYELVGRTTPEQHEQMMGEVKRGRVHGVTGSIVGPGTDLTNKESDDVGNSLDRK